jgi:L-lactate dehydrogenase complex protein LldG
MLIDRLFDYGASVTRIALDDSAPDAVAATVARLVTGSVVVPADLPAEWVPAVSVLRDEPPLDVRVLDAAGAVATACAVAIAETGTIVLDGGPGQGRRVISLVPDHHVVIVRADQVVAGVPEAISELTPTAPQTWISGPSATSDIELQRVEGVHGPRRLDVVLLT